ncbi:unnamed protein product [Gadus morhua 'NCC']
MESGSLPTLLGSATNLEQASSSSAYIQQLLSRDVACPTDHLETHTVATRLSLKILLPHFKSEEDCEAFGDRSTQRGATSESLGVDGPGSSHMSSHGGELKILSVYGKGEGPLAVDGHDTLFTASEVEALNSLSADHSAAKSLERGERLVCREELSVQQQTPDTISIKVEEDIGGGMPAVEDGNDIRDRSTQRGVTSESPGVDAPGSSHMASHNGELRILSVYGKGEGPLAVDGHDTLFITSEVEALSSLSADCSVAKSLNCSVRLVRLEELTGPRGGRKGRPGVLGGKGTAVVSTVHWGMPTTCLTMFFGRLDMSPKSPSRIKCSRLKATEASTRHQAKMASSSRLQATMASRSRLQATVARSRRLQATHVRSGSRLQAPEASSSRLQATHVPEGLCLLHCLPMQPQGFKDGVFASPNSTIS